MNKDQLHEVALAMVAPGKGILAADESTGTIQKRFDDIKVENTEDNRRDYREFMFRSQKAMKEHISGVILFDETIRQKAKDGTPLVKLIEAMGSIPGIKVDKSAHPMPMFPGETITEGLDGLPKRMKDYYDLGARFAKWRAVIVIDKEGRPTAGAVRANMAALARYAAICQEADIVPIVEPEVLMDGAHSIERNYEVTEFVLKTLYDELYAHRVWLEGTILKPNMVIPGEDAPCGLTGADRRVDGEALQELRADRRARHRLPLRRPVRRRGHRQPRCHRQARTPPLEHHVFVWPRPASRRAACLGRQEGAGGRRLRRLHAPRLHERAGAARDVVADG